MDNVALGTVTGGAQALGINNANGHTDSVCPCCGRCRHCGQPTPQIGYYAPLSYNPLTMPFQSPNWGLTGGTDSQVASMKGITAINGAGLTAGEPK